MAMSSVFHRADSLPVAKHAEGVWITDTDGRRYLDACGGAIVNGIGHGRREVVDAIAGQLQTLDYVHAHSFSSEAVEHYGHRLAGLLPMAEAKIFPVSGGSEATETAIKLARAYHLANGEPQRIGVLARLGSYHGNTLGALDVSGRTGSRDGYEPWLGRFDHVAAVCEYRCPNPQHPAACGRWHAGVLERAILGAGPDRVAAFIAEPIGGASLGAAVPTDDYWPAVVEVCRRYGVLVIVDEVMTGFGRTGRWFGIEHFGVEPDIMVMAKGASSGYWPLGLCAAQGRVAAMAEPVFTHGYTYSHHPAGAAAGLAVLEIIHSEGLVERSEMMGRRLIDMVRNALGNHPNVGDIRGRGLFVGIEFVLDRATKTPFPATPSVAAAVRSAAIRGGVVTYPVTGCADGGAGDGILLGPPLVVSEQELDLMVSSLTGAVTTVLG